MRQLLVSADIPAPSEVQILRRESTKPPLARASPMSCAPPGSGLELSAVAPFYNESENILGVLGELRLALDALNLTYEVLAVDDGSEDDTGMKLRQVARSWPQLCVLSHAKNSGQAAALWTAFQKATGELVAVLDGDGQNDPSALRAMISHLSLTNSDMVAGVRAKRRDSLLRRIMSRTANRVRQAFLKDGVSDSGCALKVMRREVCGAFIPLRTLYSFMPALAVVAGFKVVEMAVPHRERTAGLSKYGLMAMLWRPALDMIGVWWFGCRRFPSATYHE
ncbi:MAG: glycosyltransferase family 2 protein [Luteolibacter sp.]